MQEERVRDKVKVYIYTRVHAHIHMVLQKELYNFGNLYKIIQRTYIVFGTVVM
jgi:hypothetical protein